MFAATGIGSEQPLAAFAGFGPHGEGLGEEVAESVAGVGAEAVGLIEFGGGLAELVGAPADTFEVFDEFFALGVDKEAGVAGSAEQAAIDEVDAVAYAGTRRASQRPANPIVRSTPP